MHPVGPVRAGVVGEDLCVHHQTPFSLSGLPPRHPKKAGRGPRLLPAYPSNLAAFHG